VGRILIAALLVSLAPLRAQETPPIEVFGGYSVETLRSPDGGCSRYNGWNASVARRLIWKVSLVADLGGHYGREFEVVDNRVHTFLFGPQVTLHDGRIAPFVHVLLGVSRLTSDSGGPVLNENAFTWGGGVGVDVRINRHWSVRMFQIDYLSRQFFGEPVDGGRVLGGVVFRFGR
jgi:hypothetical protein